MFFHMYIKIYPLLNKFSLCLLWQSLDVILWWKRQLFNTWCKSDEVGERHLDMIYLKLEMWKKERCSRVIQFPISLQYKQGMKPRDTNNTDRIPLCALSHNFLWHYEYMALDIVSVFKQYQFFSFLYMFEIKRTYLTYLFYFIY